MDVRRWLTDWIGSHGGFEKSAARIAEDVNFIDAQWLDSFGVMEMVDAVEVEFGIRFEKQDFESQDFLTIGGLARLIERHRVN